MNLRIFGCGKFRWLAIEKYDRELNPKEDSFYRKHREVCFPCMRYEQQGTNAMNLLSAGAMEVQVGDEFNDAVLRKLRTKPRAESALKTWSPVLAGAVVAGLSLIAAFQLMSKSPVNLWKAKPAQGADNRDIRYYNRDAATYPNLVLPREMPR